MFGYTLKVIAEHVGVKQPTVLQIAVRADKLYAPFRPEEDETEPCQG